MIMKFRDLNINLLTLLSVIFFLVGIVLSILSAGGVAFVVTTFSKIFIFLAIASFIISVVLFFLGKRIKVQ